MSKEDLAAKHGTKPLECDRAAESPQRRRRPQRAGVELGDRVTSGAIGLGQAFSTKCAFTGVVSSRNGYRTSQRCQ
jgi:hypothetical protein